MPAEQQHSQLLQHCQQQHWRRRRLQRSGPRIRRSAELEFDIAPGCSDESAATSCLRIPQADSAQQSRGRCRGGSSAALQQRQQQSPCSPITSSTANSTVGSLTPESFVIAVIDSDNRDWPLPAATADSVGVSQISNRSSWRRETTLRSGNWRRVDNSRMGDTESPVLALGRTKAQLASAKNSNRIVASRREETGCQLRISYPSVWPRSRLRHRYEQFRDSALKWCGGDRGINDGVFQGAARLHVTCAPLLLLTARRWPGPSGLLDEFGRDRLPELGCEWIVRTTGGRVACVYSRCLLCAAQRESAGNGPVTTSRRLVCIKSY
uniref:Uncharacterized protein n=1 Tax=Macrostomum lignano TaxID=282301 RepID=A0A1I8JNS7_9PLAT